MTKYFERGKNVPFSSIDFLVGRPGPGGVGGLNDNLRNPFV